VEPVTDVVDSERANIRKLVGDLAGYMPAFKACAKSTAEARKLLDQRGAETEAEIKRTDAAIRAALTARTARLIQEARAVVASEAARLYDPIATKAFGTAKQAAHLVDFAGSAVAGSDAFLMEVKTGLEASLREMLATNFAALEVPEPVITCALDVRAVAAAIEANLAKPVAKPPFDPTFDVVDSTKVAVSKEGRQVICHGVPTMAICGAVVPANGAWQVKVREGATSSLLIGVTGRINPDDSYTSPTCFGWFSHFGATSAGALIRDATRFQTGDELSFKILPAPNRLTMHNLRTGQTSDIPLPQLDGWHICAEMHIPGQAVEIYGAHEV
jgi:hypothetical protein